MEGHRLSIHTPLISLTKAETVESGTAAGADPDDTELAITHQPFDRQPREMQPLGCLVIGQETVTWLDEEGMLDS